MQRQEQGQRRFTSERGKYSSYINSFSFLYLFFVVLDLTLLVVASVPDICFFFFSTKKENPYAFSLCFMPAEY